MASWQWCGSDGCYLSYDPPTSEHIESAFGAEKPSVIVLSGGHTVIVDLTGMFQTVPPSSDKRKVRRWHREDFNVPPTWDHMHVGDEIVVVDVPSTSVDYIKCSNMLFGGHHNALTKQSHKIARVQRIQNLPCLRSYTAERENLRRRRGAEHLNEQYLFHGTKGTHPLEVAAQEEGFVVEMNREKNAFGRGC